MSKLENYYGKFCEDKRLLSRHGQVEYTTSMKYIHKYLKSEDRILDIGAGTGKYSIELANMGYNVTAVELVKHNLMAIKENSTKVNTILGNAINLRKIKDNSYVNKIFKQISKYDNITNFSVNDATLNEIFIEKVGQVYEK